MRYRLVLVLTLVPILAGTTRAGLFFGKKASKPDPAKRVPELIGLVKNDGDESKRAKAAEELRHYDPAAYPYIVAVLIDVLITDKKPSVRAEAAQSLGKIRPVSRDAGLALEQAVAKDPSMRVRLQARSALLQYHWAGYRTIKPDDVAGNQTKEPPLADPPGNSARGSTTGRLAPQPGQPSGPRLLPAGPPIAPAVRTITTREPPMAPQAPARAPEPKGPDLD